MSASQGDPAMPIPALDPTSGSLPTGRYLTTLAAVAERFVTHDEFAESTTRPPIWAGFMGYVEAWQVAEQELGQRIVLAWWLAGSFVSSEKDPEDIDITPVLNDSVIKALAGSPGMGKVKALIKHRDSVREKFLVDAFALRWSAVRSTLFPDALTPAEQRMLAHRGGLDEWWGRERPQGSKGPPEVAKTFVERGYLEVLR